MPTITRSLTTLLVLVLSQTVIGQESLRIATLNASLYRSVSGELLRDLDTGTCEQAISLARILQTVRPDIVLINEIDYDDSNACAIAFHDRYLATRRDSELEPIRYNHLFSESVNTGIPSGMDLDNDGRNDGPGDAWGYGRYPGQYGMVVYSRYPFHRNDCRTFQTFLWSALPNAKRPTLPDQAGATYYNDETFERLRLSSKSHWDLAVRVKGRLLHVLVSHPTPPVFDGAEDRNGCRNHDEIRFWSEYVSGTTPVKFLDDQGRAGPLAADADFVLLGDLNSDPVDGTGQREAIVNLLSHPRITDPKPTSRGAVESARRQSGVNREHRAPDATDTAKFSARAAGNLRVDYVLPSRSLRVVSSGVFWPTETEKAFEWIESSDHRLVWVDVAVP